MNNYIQKIKNEKWKQTSFIYYNFLKNHASINYNSTCIFYFFYYYYFRKSKKTRVEKEIEDINIDCFKSFNFINNSTKPQYNPDTEI